VLADSAAHGLTASATTGTDTFDVHGPTIIVDGKTCSDVARADGIVRDDATTLVRLSRSGFICSLLLFLGQWVDPAVGRAAKLLPRDPALPTGTLEDGRLRPFSPRCQPAETVTCTDAPWQAS
jgi:hypothetical protein